MRILLIDTAGGEGSLALADTEVAPMVIASEVLPGRTSSERLVPAVRRMLEDLGWRLRELAAVVVVHGPGSFTGVRVGVSAAKGLSEAGGVGLIAVSRLALLAGAVEGAGTVSAALDAGRGELYFGEYAGRRCVREALMSEEGVREAVGHGVVVVCEAKVGDVLAGLDLRGVREPQAEDALAIALERIGSGDFDDAALLDANYLRRTDAEIFAKTGVKSGAEKR
jgi:tRNA threonylcarbamoyladenosine biosynthesis protein TsaB